MEVTAEVITAIGAVLAAVSVGALLKIVSVFLKHIKAKDDQFTTFLSNHMSRNTRAMERVAERLESLDDRVREIKPPSVEVEAADKVRVGPSSG